VRSTPTSVSQLLGSHETPPNAAGARSTAGYSSFRSEAVLHGQPWARVHRSRAPFALPLLAVPRADTPGKFSGTVNAVIPIIQRQHRLRWRLADADRTEDSKPLTKPSKHRSTTSGTETKHQPALSAETSSRLTRSTEQLLHALPPRLMHSLQALGHCSAASQSPKWPPRPQLSVIVS